MKERLNGLLLEILKDWEKTYFENKEVWKKMKDIGFDIESPVGNSIWLTFDKYTQVIEKIYNTDFLTWYCWENNMGERGLLVIDSEGEREIKSIDDLYDLISGNL